MNDMGASNIRKFFMGVMNIRWIFVGASNIRRDIIGASIIRRKVIMGDSNIRRKVIMGASNIRNLKWVQVGFIFLQFCVDVVVSGVQEKYPEDHSDTTMKGVPQRCRMYGPGGGRHF